MRIQLNKAHFPVTTLGFGRRVGLWTQGCSIRCPGCVSRDTWHFDESRSIGICELIETLSPWFAQSDGVTISGGEPLDQSDAILQLLKLLRSRFDGDLLLFSGYGYETIFRRFGEIVSLLDVLISEPYDVTATSTLDLRGSDNQRIFLLSDRARMRYPHNPNHWKREVRQKLDINFDGKSIWMAGIPKKGDLARIRKEMSVRGYNCQTSDQPSDHEDKHR